MYLQLFLIWNGRTEIKDRQMDNKKQRQRDIETVRKKKWRRLTGDG